MTGEGKMTDVRIIKRYQNRKLYDTHQSCYVTLEEIAQIIREGHEIQVIDNKTKNDITYITQIQLIRSRKKKYKKRRRCSTKRVIRSEEGTFTGYIKGLEGTTETEATEENVNNAFANFAAQNDLTTPTSFENTTLN